MQPCKTGDQPFSDASPNSLCSLLSSVHAKIIFSTKRVRDLFKLKRGLFSLRLGLVHTEAFCESLQGLVSICKAPLFVST